MKLCDIAQKASSTLLRWRILAPYCVNLRLKLKKSRLLFAGFNNNLYICSTIAPTMGQLASFDKK